MQNQWKGKKGVLDVAFYPCVPQGSWVSKTILDDVSLLLPCLDLWSRVYHSKNKFSPLVVPSGIYKWSKPVLTKYLLWQCQVFCRSLGCFHCMHFLMPCLWCNYSLVYQIILWHKIYMYSSLILVTVKNAKTQSVSKYLLICSKIAMAALMQKWNMTFVLLTQSSQSCTGLATSLFQVMCFVFSTLACNMLLT